MGTGNFCGDGDRVGMGMRNSSRLDGDGDNLLFRVILYSSELIIAM